MHDPVEKRPARIFIRYTPGVYTRVLSLSLSPCFLVAARGGGRGGGKGNQQTVLQSLNDDFYTTVIFKPSIKSTVTPAELITSCFHAAALALLSSHSFCARSRVLYCTLEAHTNQRWIVSSRRDYLHRQPLDIKFFEFFIKTTFQIALLPGEELSREKESGRL